MLRADGRAGANRHEDRQLTHSRQIVGIRGTEEVTPEHAGNPGLVEEDDGVGGRLEPGGDRGGQGLAGLRVVVFDEGDGLVRMGGGQRVLPQVCQVHVAIRDRGLVKVVVQGDVEEHDVGDPLQVVLELAHISAPVLADGGQAAPRRGAQVFEPAGVEVRSHVLDGVQAQPVHAGRLDVPLAPAVQLLADARLGDVYVAAHQVVKVTELGVDGLVPLLAFEEPQSVALRGFIPVDAVETRPVPREVRVRARAPRERETCPRLDRLGLADRLMAILGVDRGGSHGLRRVGAHAVVEDDVGTHRDARRAQSLDGCQILVLRPVLRRHGAPLVELAQVVQVVDAVADVVDTLVALVGGRQPNNGDAQVRDRLGMLGEVAPVAGVRCHVPGKSLQDQRARLRHGRGQGRVSRLIHPHIVAGFPSPGRARMANSGGVYTVTRPGLGTADARGPGPGLVGDVVTCGALDVP